MSTEPTEAPALVRIRGLHKYYDRHEVLKGIDLDVAPGEVIALIGRSGSGKSTLLRCVNGLEPFQAGTLTVQGESLSHRRGNAEAMRRLRQQVGMVFQSFNLFPHLTVGRNVMLAPALVQRRDARACEAQARALLGRVGLADKFDACRTSSRAGSSSVWRSRGRWRCSRRRCCATRSPRRWTRSWWARCCASSSSSPGRA